MKERPIMFSAPMVMAILAGRKTQTRRAVKLPEDAQYVKYWAPPSGRSQSGYADPGVNWWNKRGNHLDKCPYGQPGDRLWVRETWHTVDGEDAFYRADYTQDQDGDRAHGIIWRPSIHMPRRFSRITLEITGVRVDRLQDISEADAIAEGVERELEGWLDYCMPSTQMCFHPIDSYRSLWESIHGAGAWGANPWVWVIEFRRIEA